MVLVIEYLNLFVSLCPCILFPLPMKLVERILDYCEISKSFKNHAQSIGFVPTMGFLHKGHLSLVRRAREENDVVIVSIFVNPTQFGPNEDFEKYPRDLERDVDLLEKEGIDIVFVPSVDEIYGRDRSRPVPTCKHLINCLCGKSRHGHFKGVCQIVSKLFDIVKPNRAYFGQKDYQQFLVIREMVKDLKLNTEVVMCPIIREKDGLAMSSRNVYLAEEQRRAALVLYRMLKEARCRGGIYAFPTKDIVEYCKKEIENQPLVTLDYFEIRNAKDLSKVKTFDCPVVIAGAIKVGETRLIDNILVGYRG